MNQPYKTFQEDATDRSVGLKFKGEKAVTPPSFKEYPACIIKDKFPDLKLGKQDEKNNDENYFDFKKATIPEFCKELEQKIFAEPLKYALASQSPDTLKTDFYTKLKDLFWESFEDCQTDVEVEEQDQATNTTTLEVEDEVVSFALNFEHSKVIYHKKELLSLYDLQKKQDIPNFFKEKHERDIISIKISKNDGSKLASCSAEEVFIWKTSSGLRLQNILAKNRKDSTEFNQIVLSSDGNRLYIGCIDGKILCYDLTKYKEGMKALERRVSTSKQEISKKEEDVIELEGHEEKVTCLEITSDGSQLISGSEDNTVRVWDLKKFKESHLLKKHLDNVTNLALTTDETKVVSCGLDGQVIMWDLKTGKLASSINFEEEEINSLALFPDNVTVILGTNSLISFWDMKSSKMIFSVVTREEIHKCIQMTSDCKTVLYGGDEKNINIWNIGNFDKKEQISEEKEFENEILATMTPNGVNFAIVNKMGELVLWDLKTKKQKYTLKGHKNDLQLLASSNDSTQIFSVDCKKVLKAWDVQTGKEVFSLKLCSEDLEEEEKKEGQEDDDDDEEEDHNNVFLAISSDDKKLVYYSNEKLYIWSLVNVALMDVRENEYITCLAVSPDFSAVSVGCDRGLIKIFDPKNFKSDDFICLDKHDDKISSISITPDNQKLISYCFNEKNLAIWDLQRRILIRLLEADFQSETISVNYLWSTPDFSVVSINNYLLDLNNNNYMMKYRSYGNNSKQFICHKENFILDLSVDKENVFRVEKINQILSYNILLSSFTLADYFKNDDKDQDDFKDVYEGRVLLHPFKFNAFHISAMMQGESQYGLPLQDIKVPMSALLAKDTFGNNCFDILMILKDKENLKKFFDLYFRTYENSTCYYKMKLFELNYNPIRENIYSFLTNVMNLFGDTTLVNKFLDLSYVDYNEIVGDDYIMDELEEPLYFIANEMKEFSSEGQIKQRIDTNLNGNKSKAADAKDQPEDNKRKATLCCKVLALENFIDINKDTNKFNENLSQLGVSDPIFKNKVLETVVAYKWQNYAKKIYLKDLNIFLIFFSIFLINFLVIFPYRVEENSWTLENISTVLNILSIGFFMYYLKVELRQVIRDPKEYFLSGYNYIDICLIISAFAVLIVDLLNIFSVIDDSSIVKLLASISAFLFWLRAISYLRGFEGTAFMIRLIVEVVSDIRYFLLLILLFTLSFNTSIYLIQSSYDSENDSSSVALYNMFTLCYRLVLGDYTNYDNLSVEYAFYLWLMMIIFTMLLTVILLNLLISIIGKTFDNVWESKSSTRTYELLNIMSGNGGIDDEILSNTEAEKMRNQKIIGKYLFCFYNKKNEEENIEQGEFNKKVLENNRDFSDRLEQIVEKMGENSTDMDTKIEKLQNEMTSNSTKMVKMNKTLREMMTMMKTLVEKNK